MKILTALQIREADQYTIKNAPIASIDLMERAATKCFDWIKIYVSSGIAIHVICGPGNNGGDGLVVARLLIQDGFQVKVSVIATGKFSGDFLQNLDRLKALAPHVISEIKDANELIIGNDTILIDALFGTGLSRSPDGLSAAVIQKINTSGKEIISIDMPSGLFSDKTSVNNVIVKAAITLTFQYLKPALLLQENASWFGIVHILDIGLLKEAEEKMDIRFFQPDIALIKSFIQPRDPFSHKGTNGHAMLIAGGKGKMGAGILSAKACLRSGVGLVSMFVPESGEMIIQASVPEAMSISYNPDNTVLPDFTSYRAIGAGPGLGTGTTATLIIDKLLDIPIPMVLDADALNILSLNPVWIQRLQPESILTPHPGEFRRLAGDWKNDFDKLDKQLELAKKYNCFVVLKGKNTAICTPEGHTWFNPTGNPGMAKGGSGDILTGLITGILATGLSPLESCILGIWLHGKSGDLASAELSEVAMNAMDLVSFLPQAWKTLLR